MKKGLTRHILSNCLWGMLSLMVTLVIVLGVVYVTMQMQLPNVQVLKDAHLQVPLRVYTSDGELMAEYGAKRRIPVPLDQIPKQLIDAVLATEDARYYEHPGVDFIGLIRAAKAVISSGKKVQGASTITMQVARNFFLSRKKTYGRKLKEILLALKIDRELSKDKVLELYLNKVYFGKRAYGVAAAARVYYGETLNELTLPQMAMIAGLPQAPSANNPINDPQAARYRRDHVLERMYEVGFISKQAYEKAIAVPLTAKYHQLRIQVRAPYVAEMVRQVLVDEYGKLAYEKGFKVYTTISTKLQNAADQSLKDGLIAYTLRHGYRGAVKNLGQPAAANLSAWQKTLKNMGSVDGLQPAAVLQVGDEQAQAMLANGTDITIPWAGLSWARKALAGGYVSRKPEHANDVVSPGDIIWVQQTQDSWRLTQLPKVQGAIVALNPEDGAILALSGGFDYRLSNFNRVTMAERQPGSNFKPFIYSAALAKGYTLATLINDAPVVMQDSGENSLWRPTNDTLKFYGPTRLRVGLTQSRNLVSIRLLQRIGIPYALGYARRFGFNPNKLPHTLSLALGSGTVTPLQIAVGYSVFANGGYRVTPYFINKITGQGDTVIYQANPAKACEACISNPNTPEDELPQPLAPQVLTPQNAYLMNNALQGVIQTGTGRAAKVLKRQDLAGKTGTTNNQVDAWFSGFDAKVLCAVWVGNDNMKPIHEYGAQAALPIWIQFMRTALKGVPESAMPMPQDMVTVRIDKTTGLLAQPNQHDALYEVFRQSHEPTTFGSGSYTPQAAQTQNSPNSGDQNVQNAQKESDNEPLF